MIPISSSDASTAVAVGPTWTPSDKGGYVLPDKTLGWDVIRWAGENLVQPDGPDAGADWKWTPEQARLLLWWYAVDADGRFVFRRGSLVRIKGWG